MRHSDAILRFLDSVGRVSDGQFYLGLFHSLPRESFAVLAVDAEVVHEALDALVLDLRYLTQLDLYPVLVFGLPDGEGAEADADATAKALEASGVSAARIGTEGAVPAELLRSAILEGKLPLVALGGRRDIDARFDLLAGVLRELKTRKLIFVRSDGRLGRSREDGISIVNLSTDYEALCAADALTPGQRLLLAEVQRLFAQPMAHRLLAAVTSPLNLLKELFTVKGGGTLIKRGSAIARQGSLEGVDLERLRLLLESSFGRRLRDEFLEKPVLRIYLEESYRGAALVQATPFGPYLTKFAVEAQAQGEGLGRDLWQAMQSDHPTLFWRARPENRILPFYLKTCDGTARFPSWHVFWVGTPLEALEDTIRYALELPEDFL
jgi:acetylglutamate kinase